MNTAEKITFVKEYTASFARELITKIKSGHVPEEWDGHELRVWLADKVNRDAECSIIRRLPRGKRAKDFHNTINTTSL